MPPINLNIRRIDSRRDDIRAAMAELRRRLSPRGKRRQRGRPAADDRGLRRAAFARSRWSSGSAATWRKRAWRPCSTIRPGSTRPSSRPRRSACRRTNWPRPMPRPIRELLAAVRRVAGEHPRVSAGHPAPRRAAGAARRISGRSAIGRWIGWGFACRAGPPPIPRPC